ncbi:NAD-binding protein [Paraburkholderia sp. Tr-20389]|uniref:NAD(P)-binding domain-containing protein n=1 Tax=Paraburkholderia sp. Tr-20389 TaxID=2703903 RepID=UPI00197D3A84|nr:NAD(P)-binding domain-containing protein [Paraburkholderia sp. Tr-20389]MBN3756457.1 NAD-binding protein [Paraburkholderia sp. Tr-20389]
MQKLDALTWASAGKEQGAWLLALDPRCVLISSDVSPEFRRRILTGWKPASNVVVVVLADEYSHEGDLCLETTAHVPVVSAALSLDEKAGGRVFLSGDAAASEVAASIFAQMSLDPVYCGSRAQDARLIALMQHAICAVGRMVVIEAAGMGVRASLPIDLAASVIARSSGRSRQADIFFDGLLHRDRDEAGASGAVTRMLGNLVDVAMTLGLPLPLTSAALALLSLEPVAGVDDGPPAAAPFARYERLVGLRRDRVVTSNADESAGGDPSLAPVIGYVGLGAMGSALAMQALRVARELHVYDPDPAKVEQLKREGACAAVDVSSLASVCDLIFLCVPSAKEVEQILFGAGGMYAALGRGKIVIDQTTCSPAETVRFGERLAVAGVAMIDAPVTGGPDGARSGGLVTMCGGQEAAFSRVRPVLEAMGGEVVYFGAPGSGQAIKLVKNSLGAGNRLIVYEMLSIAAASGLQIDTLRAALSTGASASGALDRILRSIMTGSPTADASLRTVVKDQQLIGRMGRAAGSPLPLLNVARTVLEAGSRMLGPAAQIDEIGRLYGIESFQGIEKS